MHLHVLGIGGTFMSGLALIAREAGHVVTGSDINCYPPVSDLLSRSGIEWVQGYADSQAALAADVVIVGNVMQRGMPVLEQVLNHHKPYISGPQWLAEQVLANFRVLAVAGTHGKTTTTSMLAFILDAAGCNPGFLIGGIATDFNTNARLGTGDWFVIEADEYDSAFFDKRPKFMHYRPDVLIVNNLEFDHADIYPDLAAIQTQIRYVLKTVPSNGLVLYPRDEAALIDLMAADTFSATETLALSGEATWRAALLDEAGQAFAVYHRGECVAEVRWELIGRFNVENALAAIAASARVGIEPYVAASALARFSPVKRRLEVRSTAFGVTVYDDFAHHPTAIEKTLQGLRASNRHQRIVVVMELASYTMRTGQHAASRVARALQTAAAVYLLSPAEQADYVVEIAACSSLLQALPTTDAIVQAVARSVRVGDAVVVMSNRGFDGMHNRLIAAIAERMS